MELINEQVIESVIERYEKDDALFYGDQEALTEEQPALNALFVDESLDLLTDDEYELMWFVATVVYQSIKKVAGNVESVSPEKVEAADEYNWTIFGEKPLPFKAKIDPFFDNYPQEDLLAFLEDSVMDDDEEEEIVITPAGRELIFMSVKSMIDVLTA